MELVEVTEELARRVTVYRAKDGGFQRRLDQKRLPDMVQALTGGTHCPPISIAEVGEKFYLVDGQHRLAAWQVKHFPLSATITKMSTEEEASEAFISLNREQKKVSLTHILNVSKSDYAEKVRRMAADCKVNLTHIHNLMCGLLNVRDPMKTEVTDVHWALASKIMTSWMKNRRWSHEGGVYSTPGVLRLAGFFVSKTKAVDSVLKDLQSLDYTSNGPLGRVTGTSWGHQQKMKAVFHKYLAQKMLE